MTEQPENPATKQARCVNCGHVALASEMYRSESLSSIQNGTYACVDPIACSDRQRELPCPPSKYGPPQDRFNHQAQRRQYIERYLRAHNPIVHHGLMLRDVGQCDYTAALELIICYLAKENDHYQAEQQLWYGCFGSSPLADVLETQKKANELTKILTEHLDRSSTLPEKDHNSND